MMKRGNRFALAAVLAVGLVLAAAHDASAGIIINVGSHDLLPNTAGQQIQIFVSTTDSNRVGGCDLNVQVDGGGPAHGGVSGPHITAVDMMTGTIFAGNNAGQTPLLSEPEIALYSIVTNSGTVVASGLLVTLTIDTTGFSVPGTQWTLQLGNTLNGPTDFAPTVAAITDGTIQIVPEPATMALLLSGAGIMVLRRRRGK